MARFEMGGVEMAPLAGAASSAEIFYELGIHYASGGDSDAIDLVEAHKWFNLAAIKGNREAASHRQSIALEMSALQIAEAQRAAREWVRTH